MSSKKLDGGSLLRGIDHDAPKAGGTAANKPKGLKAHWKTVAGVAVVLAVAVLAYMNISDGLSNPTGNTNYVEAVDASDPEHLVPLPKFYAPAGTSAPYKSPSTGKMAVWPAEKCYWTRDGKGKTIPTLVLLNKHIGKTGDTICPDCGRKVWDRFPMPPDKIMIEAASAKREN